VGQKSRKLKVALDARKLQDGGIGQYVYSLVDGVVTSSVNREIELSLVVGPVVSIPSHWKERVVCVESSIKPYSLAEQTKLGMIINDLGCDVFHSPHFTLPRKIAIPSLVTIHDLLHVYHPERWFYPYIAGHLIWSALQRSKRVIAVSRTTAQDLKKFLSHNLSLADKIRVIPNAFDPFYYVSGALDREGEALFVAVYSNDKPHKGIDRLLAAFSMFCAVSSKGELLLVGKGSGTHATWDLLKSLRQDVRDRIQSLGQVSKEQLRSLYCRATAVVVSSLWEGFCLPVLEAHGCGVPVVTTPVPAVLELTLPGDIVSRDYSSAALSEAMQAVVDRDYNRPKSFNLSPWNREVVVEDLVAEYFAVAEKKKPERVEESVTSHDEVA
jgi:glycosyltransferase involved in cell wall biosynthesis